MTGKGKVKLIIGAGERHLPGFITHDVQALPGIDIVCEFFDLTKHVEASSCDEIHMTHVLEHFPMKDVQKVLKTVRGLLCKGGRFYIEVPNFEWHAREITRNPLNRQIVEYAFGGQLNKWDFHYNGFTPDILVDDLLEAGFKVESIVPNSSIECYAIKV